MKRRAVLAGLAAFFGAARALGASTWTPWAGPAAAPPIALFTPDGNFFSLESLRGRVVLVNFWATWCEPCVAEMPSLQRLREQLAPRLEVLGVNYQEGPARIRAFVERIGIAFPIVRDTDGSVAKAWGARVFPSSFLLDREGHVRNTIVGDADWTSPTLVSTIKRFL